MALQNHVHSPKMWAICEVVMIFLSLTIYGCVLNQSSGHLLLVDALQFIISTRQNNREKLVFQPIPDNLVQKEDVFDFELKKLIV
jgi:hypothetical protein